MPATRLAAKSPMMPLARSWLRPATGPATEPVRARAEEARGGPAPTIPPAAGRSQRQPPHPPPLPPPVLATLSQPRSPWHVQLLKPKLLLCLQLDLVGGHAVGLESPHAGVREVKVLARSSVVTPSHTPGRVRRREPLLLLAEAVATLGDGAHVAETPEKPYPRALTYSKATAYSVLLPRSCASSALLMVFYEGV